MSGFIYTYSGKTINPVQPQKEDIFIEDVAHALAHLDKSGGHYPDFYSEGEHTIYCCLEAKARDSSADIQMGCLLRRACVAYLGNITPAVKEYIPTLLSLYDRVQETIYEALDLQKTPHKSLQEIESIADNIFYHETLKFQNRKLSDSAPPIHISLPQQRPPVDCIKSEFLRLYKELYPHCTKTQAAYTVGVDVSNKQWLAAVIKNDNISIEKYTDLNTLCKKHYKAQYVIVDIPIGLEDTEVPQGRPDSELRKALPGKASSVFSVPSREAVYSDSESQAKAENIRILGKSLSMQTLAICPYIREADEFLYKNPSWKNRLLESHPEFAFAILGDGNPILERKQVKEGQELRIAVLGKYIPITPDWLEQFPYQQRDDIVDALSLAVIGMLATKRGIKTIPKEPQKDARGLYMQIVGI